MVNAAVIGSGPSGLQTALGLLRRGVSVTIIDTAELLPDESRRVADQLAALPPEQWSADLKDRARTNQTVSGGQLPKKMLFGSNFMYAGDRAFAPTRIQVQGRAPLPTFAQGGFSIVWGGACLPAADCDIEDWPVKRSDLAPFYRQVLNEVPLTGGQGTLEKDFPTFSDFLGHLPAGSQGEGLLQDLEQGAARIGDRARFGRARLAVHTDAASSKACIGCGMCFYGCPLDSIYSTVPRLRQLIREGRIEYFHGWAATNVAESLESVELTLERTSGGETTTRTFDAVFVGAGPINTTRLMLASQRIYDTPVSLRESQKFVLPLFRFTRSAARLDEPFNTLAAVFYETKVASISNHWVHVQITSVNDLMLRHLGLASGQKYSFLRPLLAPILGRCMFGWVSTHSDHSSEVLLTLKKPANGEPPVLEIDVSVKPTAREYARTVARTLFSQGFLFRTIALFPFLKFSNPGSGTHCGGSFPMRKNPQGQFDSDIYGRPFGLRRTFLVDSSVLPSLPATTTVLNVMANAARISATAPLESQ